MTSSWFNTPERIKRLHDSADSWIGTPFVPNGRVKGHGVSCQMLAEAVYQECGLDFDYRAPEANMGWSGVHRDSLIMKHLKEVDNLICLRSKKTILPGDLLGFKLGSCVHHLGVAVSDTRFIHSMKGLGTTYKSLNSPTYGSRLAKVWRWQE